MPSSDTTAPITDKSPVKTDYRTLFAVMGAVAFAAVAWATLKMESADHGRRLTNIETTISTDHDILLELRGAARAQRFKNTGDTDGR